jgi:hypothetical protein
VAVLRFIRQLADRFTKVRLKGPGSTAVSRLPFAVLRLARPKVSGFYCRFTFTVSCVPEKVGAAKGGEAVFIDHPPLTIHHQKVTGLALNSGYHLFAAPALLLIDFLKFN